MRFFVRRGSPYLVTPEPRARMRTSCTARLRRALAHGGAAAVIVLACAAYYRSSWATYSEFSRAIDPSCMTMYCDFTYFYYKQARVIRSSGEPVRKYFYTPTFALLLEPIGKLSKQRALTAWSWVQALSLLLLVAANARLLRGFPPYAKRAQFELYAEERTRCTPLVAASTCWLLSSGQVLGSGYAACTRASPSCTPVQLQRRFPAIVDAQSLTKLTREHLMISERMVRGWSVLARAMGERCVWQQRQEPV